MEDKFWNGLLMQRKVKFVCVLLLIFISGCSTDSAIEPSTSVSVTASKLPLIETPTPTPIPVMTATALPEPTATPDPILSAAESISVFTTYDDFSGPFDESKWSITEPDENNPFTYEAKDGLLFIHMNGDQFGPDRFARVDVNLQQLNEAINGVSVVLPAHENLDVSSPYGLSVNLSDQESHWTYQCYKLVQATRLYCGLEDAISGTKLHTMEAIQISRYNEIKLQVEWIPDSGLLLTFLNNQLIDYYTLPIVTPLIPENIGLFAHRVDSYADGDLVFLNFRIGTYQETDLVLPDDLLPNLEKTFQFAKHGIDYYLYDDFNSPLYENFIDLRRWSLGIEQDGTEIRGQNTFFGQQDGSLVLEGKYLLGATAREWNPSVRALQVDILSGDKSLPDSGVYLLLAGRIPDNNSEFGQYAFSNECKVEFNGNLRGRIWCHYLEGNNQTVVDSFGDTPLYQSEKNNIDLSYNEPLGAFELRVNGFLVGQSYVKEEHKELIENYGLTTEIYLANEDNKRIVLDNYMLGIKSNSDAISSEPEILQADGELPHSDLYLYDDFENAQFDGAWNVGKWFGNHDINEDVGAHQENGTLVYGKLPEGDQINAWNLHLRQFTDIPDDDINAIQIEIAPYQPQPNSLISVTIFVAQLDEVSGSSGTGNHQNMNGNTVQFGCNLLFRDAQEALACQSQIVTNGSSSPSVELENSVVSLAPERSHLLAIELDRESGIYSVYLDSNLLVEYQVPSGYFLGTQDFFLQSGGNPDNQNTVAQIENIWIGKPASHPELLSANDIQLVSFDGGSIENENVLVLPEGATDHHIIWTNMKHNFKLSDINAAAITFAPMDISLSGWSTIMAFSSSDNSYQINCNIQYDGENAAFYCDEPSDVNAQEKFRTEEIQINPGQPHQVAINVDKETYQLHVMLDGNHVFDIDPQQSPAFFEESTFNYLFMVYKHDSPGREFRMQVSDIKAGLLEK